MISRCRHVARVGSGILQCLLMLAGNNVRELLAPFDICLSNEAIDKLLVYLELLLRWNKKINLTSIGTAEECVTRHFGESFLVSRIVPLEGRLLDIGSGAGFPGLAVKLIAPDLEVVLLEPTAKKRAFLKEAARACGIRSITILGERLEEFSRDGARGEFEIVTVRAVGALPSLVATAKRFLSDCGSLCLWVGRHQVEEMRKSNPDLEWLEPIGIPFSHERLILAAKRRATGDS